MITFFDSLCKQKLQAIYSPSLRGFSEIHDVKIPLIFRRYFFRLKSITNLGRS